MILNILLSLLILNIMVIAHEFGHYLLARRSGIAVDEFAIGFGPTLLKKKWAGTLWMIKAFPLGGYNGLKGETEDAGGDGNFATAPKLARLQVLIGGSIMNILMAVFAFYIALGLYGWKVPTPMTFNPVGAVLVPVGLPNPTVYEVVKDSPASTIDAELPYAIISINGKEVLTPQNVVDEISASATDQLTLKINDKKGTRDVTVTRNSDKKIGIKVDGAVQQLNYGTTVINKIFSGFSHAINMTVLTGKLLGTMIAYTTRTGNFEPLGYAVAGPVAIVAAVGSVVKDSKTVIADLANMTGLIGISLGLFNLFPFPGLDGWHIFLLAYEKVRGRKPNQQLVGMVTAIGLFLLLGLAVLIMFKDVWLFFIK